MADIEGVTLEFFLIRNDKDRYTDIESFVSRIYTPYKYLEEKIGAKLESELEIGEFNKGITALNLNIRGDSNTIEKALDYILETYGRPLSILKPNQVFNDKDTEKGVEIASNFFRKKGYKLKCGILCKLMRSDVKYFVDKPRA